MLPNAWINIDNVILAPWPEWQGKLAISMTPVIQQIRYQGEKVKFQGQLRGQALTVSQLEIAALANQPPVSLAGSLRCRWYRMACRLAVMRQRPYVCRRNHRWWMRSWSGVITPDSSS